MEEIQRQKSHDIGRAVGPAEGPEQDENSCVDEMAHRLPSFDMESSLSDTSTYFGALDRSRRGLAAVDQLLRALSPPPWGVGGIVLMVGERNGPAGVGPKVGKIKFIILEYFYDPLLPTTTTPLLSSAFSQ